MLDLVTLFQKQKALMCLRHNVHHCRHLRLRVHIFLPEQFLGKVGLVEENGRREILQMTNHNQIHCKILCRRITLSALDKEIARRQMLS